MRADKNLPKLFFVRSLPKASAAHRPEVLVLAAAPPQRVKMFPFGKILVACRRAASATAPMSSSRRRGANAPRRTPHASPGPWRAVSASSGNPNFNLCAALLAKNKGPPRPRAVANTFALRAYCFGSVHRSSLMQALLEIPDSAFGRLEKLQSSHFKLPTSNYPFPPRIFPRKWLHRFQRCSGGQRCRRNLFTRRRLRSVPYALNPFDSKTSKKTN